MAQRITVFRMEIGDRPGSLVQILSGVARAGLDLQCLCGTGGRGGKGDLYLGPKDTEKARQVAATNAVSVTECAGFILDGDDKTGAGAEALKPLADAGINVLAGAALAKAGKYQCLVIVDAKDGDKAAQALGA